MQEARARAMGLYGKKWGPPPELEQRRAVRLNDDKPDGHNNNNNNSTRTTRRGFAGAEPTVTLATKEALADVFGMYNSPEKSMRYGAALGSKHAPVRDVEPITPMAALLLLPAVSSRVVSSNENANVPAKTPSASVFL